MSNDTTTATPTTEAFDTMPMGALPTMDIVSRLRTIAYERPGYDIADEVTLSGSDVLAIAERLQRSVGR